MKAMNFPDSRAEQIAWLESEMVGTELLSIVTELQATHGSIQQSPWSVTSWPPRTINDVRQNGLKELNDEQFTSLLTEPLRLVSVQRDVLEHGGSYWDTVASPAGIDSTLTGIGSALQREIEPSAASIARVTTQGSSAWSKLTWAALGAMATAAAMLLMTDLGQSRDKPNGDEPIAKVDPVPPVQTPPETAIASTPSGWGFEAFANRIADDGDLASVEREVYLRELASAADAWSKKKPDTPQALAARIGEFRMGCSALLLANHRPLTDSDRDWLQTRCQSWARALDRHLVAIESGENVDDVRSEVDLTVTKISAALIGRAETPS